MKSVGSKYGHLRADITGIASLNMNNLFLNIGIALLSGICLSAVNKSLLYTSHKEVNYFTLISLNNFAFHSFKRFYSYMAPVKILSLAVYSVFNSLNSLKFVYYVIYKTYSYLRCFLEY